MADHMAMGQPALDKLMESMDSRYSLVVVAARRARVITEEIENKGEESDRVTSKPVTMALREVAAGKVKFRRTKQGIK